MLATQQAQTLRIPSLSSSSTVRAIGRLLDAALAVEGFEGYIPFYAAPAGIDWSELLGDWCAMARRNDEDVELKIVHVEAQPGLYGKSIDYQVVRHEQVTDRRLLTVNVKEGA